MVPPKHAGCKRRKGCVLNKLVEAKRATENRIAGANRDIVKAGDDESRTKGFVALKAEGSRREVIMEAMAKITDTGSCEGVEDVLDGFDKRIKRENKIKGILIAHLQKEKADARAMIEECMEEMKAATNHDVIGENYDFLREEQRRIGRIDRALEQLEIGNCEIELRGLMAAEKAEKLEKLIEQETRQDGGDDKQKEEDKKVEYESVGPCGYGC